MRYSRNLRLQVLVLAFALVSVAVLPAASARAFSGLPRQDRWRWLIQDRSDAEVRAAQSHASQRLRSTDDLLPAGKYTDYTVAGVWRHVSVGRWSAGYLPGELWLQYQATGDTAWRSRAKTRQAPIGALVASSTPDSGVRYFYSYANGYRLTGDASMRSIAMTAAASTAKKYEPRLGMLRSRGSADGFIVVIDEMMNLQLLFWGARNGGPPEWRDAAIQHALAARREFVRPDGTTYHLIVFDETTGAVKEYRAGQGAAPDSTWSRGQAWAIYGFTTAYRETGDERFLETARLVADRFLADLPPDLVPYWDFEAPGIPNQPRDSSAAAIAASAIAELAILDPLAEQRAKYTRAARGIVTSLASPAYLTVGTSHAAILAHGTYDRLNSKYDSGLAWGDYFFLEAMLRLRLLPSAIPAQRVFAVSESSHVGTDSVSNAFDRSVSTSWTSKGSGQWIRLRLVGHKRVSRIAIATGDGASRSARYTLKVSSDGSEWRTLATVVSCGRSERLETFDVPDTMARYVRVECEGATEDTVNRISEVRVY